jgi:hypothetical protein
MQETLQLNNYLAIQEDTVLSYHASSMVLAVQSNALLKYKAKRADTSSFKAIQLSRQLMWLSG